MGASTDLDAEYDAHEGTTYVNTKESAGDQQRQTRKRWIIIGAVVAVVIAVIIVVVAVVVTQLNKDDDKPKYSKECGPFTLPNGLDFSNLTGPTLITNKFKYTCPLKGNCWSGEKCFQCFELDNWKVGNINNIPVCCPDCLIRGFSISHSDCTCRL